MPQISKEKRVFVVEKFFERKSYTAVQVALRQRFNKTSPCKNTIQQNFTKYRSYGTSLKRNKINSGRRRTARSK